MRYARAESIGPICTRIGRRERADYRQRHGLPTLQITGVQPVVRHPIEIGPPHAAISISKNVRPIRKLEASSCHVLKQTLRVRRVAITPASPRLATTAASSSSWLRASEFASFLRASPAHRGCKQLGFIYRSLASDTSGHERRRKGQPRNAAASRI